ncbi:MAG: hypothetical protein K2O04_06910 [Clostridiales bacterium]|nr:hypothetical protein [Clostridiales bacterium]
MEKLIDNTVYPVNVLSAIFGTGGDEYFYYCDKEQLEQTVNEIMQLNFTTEDCTVFFSVYKERKPISKIANELDCAEETITYIHSRILRNLRCPKLSRRLNAFTDTVKVCDDDSGLISEIKLDNEPIAVTNNGEIKAFIMSPDLYNTLNQKAMLVDKIMCVIKEHYDKLYGSL